MNQQPETTFLSRHGWIPVLAVLLLGLWLGSRMEWGPILDRMAGWTPAPWLAPVLVAAQALCFALALPGSISFIVIGLLYDPLQATVMIVIGGVTGSTLGYLFAQRMAQTWAQRVQHRSLYRFMRRNSNFLMLCAMRILPGFPHSVLNYGAGLLRIPLGRFLSSAVLGYIAKGLLYASLLDKVMDTRAQDNPLSLTVLWPMALLAILFIAGFTVQKIWLREDNEAGEEPPPASSGEPTALLDGAQIATKLY